MNHITCLHCGATTAAGAFCETCGKALPSATPTGPRIVSGADMPRSAAGQKLVGDDLSKQIKRASTVLLVVGILQLTLGSLLVLLVSQARKALLTDLIVPIGIQVVLGGIFVGLYFWARRSPLPAAIVGMVIYATLVIFNVVTTAAATTQGNRGGGLGGLGIGWLDIVIIVLLVQGIQAALKHKRLMEQQL